jgi:hypothetical protein
MGNGTPMTPVERTTTSSARSPSSVPTSVAVRCASAIPAAPVAAFATPALTTTAWGSATARCLRETSTGAARTRLVVHTAPPTARGMERTRATSGDARRIPADTPLATNP